LESSLRYFLTHMLESGLNAPDFIDRISREAGSGSAG
jgi:hypothetical protein